MRKGDKSLFLELSQESSRLFLKLPFSLVYEKKYTYIIHRCKQLDNEGDSYFLLAVPGMII